MRPRQLINHTHPPFPSLSPTFDLQLSLSIPRSTVRMRARPDSPSAARGPLEPGMERRDPPRVGELLRRLPPHRGGPFPGGAGRAGGTELPGHQRSGAGHPPGAAPGDGAAAGRCPYAWRNRTRRIARRGTPAGAGLGRTRGSPAAGMAPGDAPGRPRDGYGGGQANPRPGGCPAGDPHWTRRHRQDPPGAGGRR